MPKLFAAVGGLFAFFLMYGVVQERIMTKPYGVDEDGCASLLARCLFSLSLFIFFVCVFLSSF